MLSTRCWHSSRLGALATYGFAWNSPPRFYCRHTALHEEFNRHLDDPLRVKAFVHQLPGEARRSLIASLILMEEKEQGHSFNANTIFKTVDTNNDGVLNEEEFERWINSRSWFGSAGKDSIAEELKIELDKEVRNSKKDITNQQLLALSIQVAIPFVGFGFLDNAIMITAGNTIENSIGVVLGLSTLAAAGLGNLLSDVAGIGLGNSIEAASHKLGLPDPKLTRTQATTSKVRWVRSIASAIGIAIGCIFGMFPLLFVQSKEEERLRRIFAAIDSNGNGEIDFNELQVALEEMGIKMKPKKLVKFFQFIDVDNNGVINFEEFCYLVEHLKAKFDPEAREVNCGHDD